MRATLASLATAPTPPSLCPPTRLSLSLSFSACLPACLLRHCGPLQVAASSGKLQVSQARSTLAVRIRCSSAAAVIGHFACGTLLWQLWQWHLINTPCPFVLLHSFFLSCHNLPWENGENISNYSRQERPLAAAAATAASSCSENACNTLGQGGQRCLCEIYSISAGNAQKPFHCQPLLPFANCSCSCPCLWPCSCPCLYSCLYCCPCPCPFPPFSRQLYLLCIQPHPG